MAKKRNSLSKNAIRTLFGLITISSLIFVLLRVYRNWELIRVSTQSKPILLMVAVTGFVYFIITSLLPATWQQIVSWVSNSKINYIDCYKVYGQTQIAKYLPGNIFHLVSRQASAENLSVSQGSLVLSSLLEVISYLFIATTICLLSYIFGFRFELEIVNGLLLVFSGIILVVVLLVLVFPQLLNKIKHCSQIENFFKAQHAQLKLTSTPIISISFLVTAFFISTSLLFSSLVFWVNDGISKIYLLAVFPVFCLSYVVGLITPGAPAGFGVREAIMIVTLTPLVGNSEATLLALLFRMSTIIGDLLLFVSATFLESFQKARKNNRV